MSRITYVGLDLETSGIDIDAGAVPIQLGLALGAGTVFSSLIRWPFESGPETWSERAAEVHGIDQDAVRAASAPLIVEGVALEFLPGGDKRDLIAVGWNVGSFDFPFVQRYLPAVAARFSYRFVDLNAVCFSMAEAGARRAARGDQALGFKTWKKRAKAEAERMLGGEARWHDAGYDAAASLLAWWWLLDRMGPRES